MVEMVMRGFLPSVLAACLLLQSSRAIKSIDDIFGGRTPPYVCDSFMYNNNDASRNTSNPDVPWRGEGYPIVWESGLYGNYTMHDDCHVSYECAAGNLYSSFYYNASVFGLDQSLTYVVGTRARILERGKASGDVAVGLIAWQRGEGQEHYHKVSFVFNNLQSSEQGKSSYAFTGYAYTGNSQSHTLKVTRPYPCTIGGPLDAIDLAVFVQDASIFTLVVMLRSRPALGEAVTCTIVDSLNYSTFTFGQPPQFIGLEANQVAHADFWGLNALPWDPSLLPLPTETPHPCPNETPTILAFFFLLGTGLILLSAQVVWASKQAERNYNVGNAPSAFDLLGLVSTGVQFFAIVGQAFYLLLCIRLGGEVAAYTKYYYATLATLLTVLGYDVMVLIYFGHRYGVYLNRAQLWRHPFAYGLLGLMSIVNLELLILYPWNYQYFPMAPYLPGYPTPRLMRWCAVPTIILSCPALIIQVLTNNMSNGYKSSDAVLFACTAVTSVDMLLHFFLRVYRIQEETQHCSRDLLRTHSGEDGPDKADRLEKADSSDKGGEEMKGGNEGKEG